MSNCAECSAYVCRVGVRDKGPADCPMTTTDLTNQLPVYSDPEIKEFARIASLVEGTGYGRWSRLEEIMELCKMNGFKRLGVAFCAGFRNEAKVLHHILEANGFQVASAMCKTGAIPKEELGIRDEEKVRPGGKEMMCNPIAQAALLNDAETQFNIVLGLCVGHDSLFIKFSKAWVTPLAVKDRVLGHNPIAALYMSEGYYKKRLYEDHKDR